LSAEKTVMPKRLPHFLKINDRSENNLYNTDNQILTALKTIFIRVNTYLKSYSQGQKIILLCGTNL